MSEKRKLSDSYVFLTISTFIFLGLVVLYVFEFTYLTNTRNVRYLIKTALMVAFIMAVIVLIAGYLTRILVKESVKLHIYFALLFMAFSPFFASITNRKLSTKKPYSEAYEYKGQKGYYMELFSDGKNPKFDTYWLYLKKNDMDFKFRTNAEMPLVPGMGANVRLVFNRGYWGFDYFDGQSWEFI